MIGRLRRFFRNLYLEIKYRREWQQWKQENMSDWARDNGLVTAMAWFEFKDQHPEIDFNLDDAGVSEE